MRESLKLLLVFFFHLVMLLDSIACNTLNLCCKHTQYRTTTNNSSQINCYTNWHFVCFCCSVFFACFLFFGCCFSQMFSSRAYLSPLSRCYSAPRLSQALCLFFFCSCCCCFLLFFFSFMPSIDCERGRRIRCADSDLQIILPPVHSVVCCGLHNLSKNTKAIFLRAMTQFSMYEDAFSVYTAQM